MKLHDGCADQGRIKLGLLCSTSPLSYWNYGLEKLLLGRMLQILYRDPARWSMQDKDGQWWSGKSAHNRAQLQSSTGIVTWKNRIEMYTSALNVDMKQYHDINCYMNGFHLNMTLICNITIHVLNVYLYTSKSQMSTRRTWLWRLTGENPIIWPSLIQKLFKQGFDHREGLKKKKIF